MKSGATAETNRFLECMDDDFVTQHVTEPTRSNAVLDLVMTRDPDLINSISVTEPLRGSDHNMVIFVIHHQWEIADNVKEIRDYLKADYDKIRSELASKNWDELLVGNADECWYCFKEVIFDLKEQNDTYH